RFCSLSWYDRQLIENSRGDGKKAEGPSTSDVAGEEGEKEGPTEAAVASASTISPPPARLHCSDGGFGVRARPAEASVLATLKARGSDSSRFCIVPPSTPRQDLDPWVTAPIFEDECNAMDPIGAMVAGRPPFASSGSDGSSSSLRDCPSPPRGRPGDGPLDALCESWEENEEERGGGGGDDCVSADAFVLTPADAASMQEFQRTYEDLGGGPIASFSAIPGGMSASAPAVSIPSAAPAPAASPGLAKKHATSLDARQAEGAVGVKAPAPGPFSGTPPPVPAKPTSVTTAFIAGEITPAAETVAPNTGKIGLAAATANETGNDDDGGAPGTTSSQDLLLEWLRREAGKGDEEAQFHLAQLFSPPRFEMKPECRECGEPFGVTRYRHHCRHCGGSFCHEHAWHEHPIPKLGLPAPQRVCTPCKHTLELEDWRERVEWRLERVNAYLESRLIPYFDTGVDTVGDKALRVVDGAIYVAKSAPLGTAVKISVEVMDVLMKYGTAGVAGLVLRREFVEAVEVLKRLSGVDKKWPMSVHEMTAAMYYLLAQRRGERGSAPNAEHEAHADCEVISDAELAFLRRMSALPLHFAYTKTALELQQVLCNTTGWSLVFHKPDSRFHQPAFSLLACRTTMTAALVVRGTGSIQDVITDIQAMPVPFPAPKGGTASDADGWSDLPSTETVACSGMARAAEWLHREVRNRLGRPQSRCF
ncbi:unnamed protein product, partial [Hapterophycus canaliculatus]